MSFSSTIAVLGLVASNASPLRSLPSKLAPTLLLSCAHRKMPVSGLCWATAIARLVVAFKIFGLLRLVPETINGFLASISVWAISRAEDGVASFTAFVISIVLLIISLGASRIECVATSSNRSAIGVKRVSGLFSAWASSLTAASCHSAMPELSASSPAR